MSEANAAAEAAATKGVVETRAAQAAATKGVAYGLDDWLARANTQPDLPAGAVPRWLAHVVAQARNSDFRDAMGDRSRVVPEIDEDGNPPRYSAVLVLLSGDPTAEGDSLPEDAKVLLTHRTPTMRNHSGQIAFPGGMREPYDAGPIDTAVREATEETGLDPETITPLAVMQPLYIQRSSIAVVPVLAYWHSPHHVHPATGENDWVHPVSIPHLVNPESRMAVEFLGWSGPAFIVGTMVLWGFTGGVIDTLLRTAGWEKPWNRTDSQNLFSVLERSSNGEALKLMRDNFTGDGE